MQENIKNAIQTMHFFLMQFISRTSSKGCNAHRKICIFYYLYATTYLYIWYLNLSLTILLKSTNFQKAKNNEEKKVCHEKSRIHLLYMFQILYICIVMLYHFSTKFYSISSSKTNSCNENSIFSDLSS